jgi:hypothetical protein
MAFVLEVADLNSQAFEATLDDILYYIVLNWNESGQYWTIAIRNSAYVTIINDISISANFPLTRQFRYADMPPGEIVAQSFYYRSGPIPRDGFATGRYQLVYYTQQDLLLAGILPALGFTASAI